MAISGWNSPTKDRVNQLRANRQMMAKNHYFSGYSLKWNNNQWEISNSLNIIMFASKNLDEVTKFIACH
jgi:hypothetical protein